MQRVPLLALPAQLVRPVQLEPRAILDLLVRPVRLLVQPAQLGLLVRLLARLVLLGLLGLLVLMGLLVPLVRLGLAVPLGQLAQLVRKALHQQ